ncbi:M20/M25/M40 family metallo-hydrolase [Solihabitans fulvus]|uniref:M20/M25/M40 family metallo-hydrolase n=1 Tax=Solihabitans fulvus TaxID=1892852 RepID=A0A5B2X469_9PSEU|nr:M20/M25/M40 family metallo-hydrolase [Solihabitans fulvus]KAA2258034.1 M20/M25/M40 family metallo-hydrolase [Solihabitans fulvus]
MDEATARDRVSAMMPEIIGELGALVGHASVAFPGFPAEPVHRMADATVDLLRRCGADDARLLEIPGGYPAVYADIKGPLGAPTVLLYGHYDVQPAPKEQGWHSDPWTAVTKDDGRMYGRGVADDKSGIAIHAATLRAFEGAPPVGIRILIEGEEETISHLEEFVEANPELVRCDAFVIADMGNVTVGEPALTTALRGDVSATVRVRTLGSAVHSGLFGGPAPDALTALARILATLHDEAGDVAVAGVRSYPWSDGDFPAEDFRSSAGLLPGVELIGTGTVASRLWSKPAVSVIGIDAPSVAEAANVLVPEATAKISMRIVPGADADRELDLLMDHLRRAAPWNVDVEVTKVKAGHPFEVDMSGPVIAAAQRALGAAFGRPSGTIGSGGSIPLVATLKRAAPKAEVILWGAEDLAHARIHAPDESVDPAEVERMALAQVLTLQYLADAAAN